MRTNIIKSISLIAAFLMLISIEAYGQSKVCEISWNVGSQNYKGLLVLYPNNKGFFKVKTYIAGIGLVWVQQDAVLTNEYDVYGNCTSYINCYNPRTNPYIPWAADNFIIYPNGSMYTQDAGGAWSTLITAYMVAQAYWPAKFNEYRVNIVENRRRLR